MPDPPPAAPVHRNGLGILFLLGAFGCFTLMDAMAKILAVRYDPVQIVWTRYVVNTVLVFAVFTPRLTTLLPARQPGLQILRSVAQLSTVLTFFVALQYIGLAEATALADLNPVLVTLGAALFLGERLGPRRIVGIIVAFVGAMIIIRPGAGVFHPASLLALATAVLFAAGMLLTRLIQRDGLATSVLWSAAIGLICSSVAVPFFWTPIQAQDLWVMLALGVFGTVGMAMIIKGYSLGEATALAPFGYTGLIWATLWGVLFFGQIPDIHTIIGALVIVGAGIYVWARERRA
ncbi:hypothetical protein BFP70_03045 [Thioclava sp. SK-1]|uniref:DMT family transporter n=1 Tax=Thioclava sp. SK-1 TaxID=1889770 RepID=UPI000824EEDD|nr:DMT family transporter [Thioclava sp. SK-1]OCX67152.1 hypothetical protein BFP70_03045 [Thioclava sp. SK-1]